VISRALCLRAACPLRAPSLFVVLSARPPAAARAVEGLTHDGVILNVHRVEIAGARTLEMTGEPRGEAARTSYTLVRHEAQGVWTCRLSCAAAGVPLLLSHSVALLLISARRRPCPAGDAGGSLPIILVTSQVQYLHTVRNKKVSEEGRPPRRNRARKSQLSRGVLGL
jgi:hypothetical protein